MSKWFATARRDFVRQIKMGPLVVAPLGVAAFGTEEIAPARVIELPAKAGQVWEFKTKKARTAFIAAVNAENPAAVVENEVLEREQDEQERVRQERIRQEAA